MTPRAQQIAQAGAALSTAVGNLNRAVSSFPNALNYRVTSDLADMAVTLDSIKERMAAQYSAELSDIAGGIQPLLNTRTKQLQRQLNAVAKPAQNANQRLQQAVASDMARVS